MRLIHCADLHLDSKMRTHLSKEMAKERRTELLLTFQRMVEYAALHHVDGILIAGDLFDTKQVSATARNVVADAIGKHGEMLFFYLRGNHDRDNFLSGLEEIPENLKLFDETWTSYQLSERIALWGMELNEHNAGSDFYSLRLDQDCFNIVMLHGQEADTGARDDAQVIPLRSLRNLGIDYLALGHVHGYREAALDGRGVYCYPGCLEGRGFDECGAHGFVVLDIDEETGCCQRRFVPFASRILHRIPVDVSECRDTMDVLDLLQECISGAFQIQDQDLVRFELTGAVDVEMHLDTDYLEKHLASRAYLVRVVDETTWKVDAEAYLLDESLKGEFVRQVMGAEDISAEDRAAVIRFGLRAIAGEEVLECD